MNRTFFFLISTCFLSFNSNAKDVTVYKWVDDRGIVHYGQHEPVSEDFTEVTIESSYSPVQAPLKHKSVENDLLNNSVDVAQASSIQCKNAKAKLRTLNDFANVEIVDASGKTRVLSPTEKSQRREISQKEVEIYCRQ